MPGRSVGAGSRRDTFCRRLFAGELKMELETPPRARGLAEQPGHRQPIVEVHSCSEGPRGLKKWESSWPRAAMMSGAATVKTPQERGLGC